MPGPSAEPLTAGDLLTLEQLAHFRRTSILRGAGLVAHAWGLRERMERAAGYGEIIARAMAARS